jgi:hypothetical protein
LDVLQVWGSVMPLSFFPAYCGIVLLSAAVVQKLFVVRVTLHAMRSSVASMKQCLVLRHHVDVTCMHTMRMCAIAGSTPWQPLYMCPDYVLVLALVFVQENKKVQEISGNITKSISAAF